MVKAFAFSFDASWTSRKLIVHLLYHEIDKPRKLGGVKRYPLLSVLRASPWLEHCSTTVSNMYMCFVSWGDVINAYPTKEAINELIHFGSDRGSERRVLDMVRQCAYRLTTALPAAHR